MHPSVPSPTRRIAAITVVVVGSLVWWAYPSAFPPLRSAGIVTGWIGSGLLLVSLVLMVREPALARSLGGLEPMYRWHHVLGVAGYLALLVHPLALAADGWDESRAVAWATLSPWQQGWSVRLGWASLVGMMAGLLVALRPRLAYAAWRGWHHLLTLSVALGATHLVGLGLDGLLLAVPALLVVLVLWRVFRADLGLGARPYVVGKVDHLSATTVELTLEPLAAPAGDVPARPGQFVLAAFPAGPAFPGGSPEFHPFTVSAVGEGGRLALGIKALGDDTSRMQSIGPGSEARVQGPFGDFFRGSAGPALWVAGGIGITPFIGALRAGSLADEVHLVYLHREGRHAPYVEQLHELALGQPRLRLRVEDTGDTLPDLARLLPAAADLRGHDCFLCGPAALVDASVRLLRERGVDARRIHFERFDFR